MKFKYCLFLCLLCLLQSGFGQNLRKISSREGISNNAVLSLCQDRNGYVWLGTVDGLNLWDGNEMQIFQPRLDKANHLSGNLIEEIVETNDNLFWLRTNYGLDKFDPKNKLVERHSEFEGMYRFTTRRSNEVFVVLQNNVFYYYNKLSCNFKKSTFKDINYSNILDIVFGDDNNLWFFTYTGIFYSRITYLPNGDCNFSKIRKMNGSMPLISAFKEKNKVYFVDSKKVLYEFDLLSKQITYVKNLNQEINQRGKISSIVKDKNDYIIAFQTNGVIRLKYVPESGIKYVTQSIGIYCGVFSLLKDRNQNVIWIGTDGQGLFQYSEGPVIFKSVTYDDLPVMISKPIRSLFLDKENSLWIGTKGDGIFRISDFYHCESYTSKNTVKLTTNNSALTNNTVYAFAPSRRNLIWIAGDGPGLNYYSYKDKKIHIVPLSEKIKYVHALQETDNSTLWVATVGNGLYKIVLSGSNDNPLILRITPIYINNRFTIKNFFFSLYQENDSIIWFGNRGEGSIRYNIKTNRSSLIKFNHKLPLTANDIFSIYKGNNKMWFGTGSGLIACPVYNPASSPNITQEEQLTRNNVHCISEDSRHNIWLSTNRGIIEYFPNGNFVNYGYSYGLSTIEYSDGACFRDEKNNVMFFGGINGLVTISETKLKEPVFNPPVLFKDIQINEEIFSVNSLLNDGTLMLRHYQNFFTLSISVLDYINGSNYSYYYKLEGYNKQWMNNFNQNKISFTSLPPGSYLLHVRYHNNVMGIDSPVYDLNIKILPPWYKSVYAEIIYLILTLGLIGSIIRYYLLRYKKRKKFLQQKLDQAQKEELYESKLRFFTNITRELSTPLTLIGGPCQQILSYENIDEYVKNYAVTIQRNVSKLNELLFMLNEFRGSGYTDNQYKIELLSISQICHDISQTYLDYSRKSHIDYKMNVEQNLVWPVDRDNLSMILNTLLSNALKNTQDYGEIFVDVLSENEHLIISVSNSFSREVAIDFDQIFDRYKVLDYFEKQSESGISSSGGLELAICHNIVEKMQGTMSVDRLSDIKIAFIVKLPRLEISKLSDQKETIIVQDRVFNLPVLEKAKNKEYSFDRSRQSMFIINENPEILSFIAEVFSTTYNVAEFSDTDELAKSMAMKHPDIIICGAMSQSLSDIDFIKQIKQDKQTTHIPVIFLSSNQQKEEQLKGIESGADICLVLPFDVEYLKAVTEQLLKKNQSLKDYYKSSLSSFELIDGQMLHKDDKDFIDKMIKIINDNITNIDISTQFVADAMGISVRNLYRRLDGITEQTPVNIIKEYRLHIAEQLLVSTKLSIDEIIYKSGFNNRGTFFKCFSVKFGYTPKAYRERKIAGLD
nr:two-component regulator propeller domain-containing protein [uncultured Bacteroides sp.]